MKLYNVFYIDDKYGDLSYEGTTDNFEKWLEKHNKSRIKEGDDIEKADCFESQEIYPIIFNKEESE
jgi:hypothetical protein